MDHAVSLVQAYLQLNGYFTSAEFPVFAGAGRNGARAITDIDILAFRFPSGAPLIAGRRAPQGLNLKDIDEGLGVSPGSIDLIIGEVKEGRVGINAGIRDPEVLRAVISRFGSSDEEDERITGDLIDTGNAALAAGYMVRLIAFGSFAPGSEVPPCRIISLGHVLDYLQAYVRKHWDLLRHLQFKDPAFGFLMTLEKARRGGAGRRGNQGVEVVPAVGTQRVPRPPVQAPVAQQRPPRRR